MHRSYKVTINWHTQMVNRHDILVQVSMAHIWKINIIPLQLAEIFIISKASTIVERVIKLHLFSSFNFVEWGFDCVAWVVSPWVGGGGGREEVLLPNERFLLCFWWKLRVLYLNECVPVRVWEWMRVLFPVLVVTSVSSFVLRRCRARKKSAIRRVLIAGCEICPS